MSGTKASGRKRKPHELKVLEGQFIPPAVRNNPPPAVVGGFPAPPDDLSEAEARLWATFPKPGWIGETDVLAVRVAVTTYALLLQVLPRARDGESAAISQAATLSARLMAVLATLGLTPADRSKMQVPASSASDDKWAGFLN